MVALPAPAADRPGAALGGIATGVAAGVLALSALGGRYPLAVAVLATQVLAGLAWLVVANSPTPARSAVLVALGAVAADWLALRDSPTAAGDGAGVVALVLVVAVLAELVRRQRDRVVTSLAATMSAVVFVVLGAQLVVLRTEADGERLVVLALLAVAGGVVLGRWVDRAVGGTPVLPGAGRAWAGLLTQLAAAAGFGALLAVTLEVKVDAGTLVGLAGALAAVAADLAVVLAAGVVHGRRRAACRTLGALLPPLLAAPATYAAARLLTG